MQLPAQRILWLLSKAYAGLFCSEIFYSDCRMFTGLANKPRGSKQDTEAAIPAEVDAEASQEMLREEQHALEALYGSSRVSFLADQLRLQLPLPDVRFPPIVPSHAQLHAQCYWVK